MPGTSPGMTMRDGCPQTPAIRRRSSHGRDQQRHVEMAFGSLTEKTQRKSGRGTADPTSGTFRSTKYFADAERHFRNGRSATGRFVKPAADRSGRRLLVDRAGDDAARPEVRQLPPVQLRFPAAACRLWGIEHMRRQAPRAPSTDLLEVHELIDTQTPAILQISSTDFCISVSALFGRAALRKSPQDRILGVAANAKRYREIRNLARGRRCWTPLECRIFGNPTTDRGRRCSVRHWIPPVRASGTPGVLLARSGMRLDQGRGEAPAPHDRPRPFIAANSWFTPANGPALMQPVRRSTANTRRYSQAPRTKSALLHAFNSERRFSANNGLPAIQCAGAAGREM